MTREERYTGEALSYDISGMFFFYCTDKTRDCGEDANATLANTRSNQHPSTPGDRQRDAARTDKQTGGPGEAASIKGDLTTPSLRASPPSPPCVGPLLLLVYERQCLVVSAEVVNTFTSVTFVKDL